MRKFDAIMVTCLATLDWVIFGIYLLLPTDTKHSLWIGADNPTTISLIIVLAIYPWALPSWAFWAWRRASKNSKATRGCALGESAGR